MKCKNSFKFSVILFSLILGGCATYSRNLEVTEPSLQTVNKISSYNCQQTLNRTNFISKKINTLSRSQDRLAMSDRILLSWGWMLYGIPYFWLDGDDQTTDLLKKHLGEVSLLEDKLIENNCSMPNSNFNFNMN